jgi:hypothetical protein
MKIFYQCYCPNLFYLPETGSDFSMFEALRDTIYSEVATLISQNESRPHFLIELFHELQLLNTDYLRQRALYALQVSNNQHSFFYRSITMVLSGYFVRLMYVFVSYVFLFFPQHFI